MKTMVGNAVVVIGCVLALCGVWMFLTHPPQEWNGSFGPGGDHVLNSLDDSMRKSILEDTRFKVDTNNEYREGLRKTGIGLTIVGVIVSLTGAGIILLNRNATA